MYRRLAPVLKERQQILGLHRNIASQQIKYEGVTMTMHER